MANSRFAAMPPRAEIFDLALLATLLALWFGLCYGGAAALAEYIPWRVRVDLPLDARVPFWPGAAALYLTIGPMMLLAPFVLRDLASLLPLFVALMAETTLAAAFFLLLPINDAPVSCEAATFACGMWGAADTLNLHHNNMPSLHVAFACTVALAYAPRASLAGAGLLYLWAALVAGSTLLTHQHFVLDVAAGMLLAAVAWRVGGAWARQPRVLAAFDIELTALRNLARIVPRHRRYLAIALAVLAAGIPHWRRHRLTRVGFVFLQSLDDLLDGDRPSPREPLEIADELRASLETGEFGTHELARLGASFRAELLARGGREALADASALIRAMRNDRRRVLAREIATREQLQAIHHATFSTSIDLLMRAAESRLRHTDVPLFIEALGWCSTVRDLREDLAQGLVNVPADVFTAATAERAGVPLPVLVETQAVQQWLAAERARAATLLDAVDDQLRSLSHLKGASVLLRFARSMRKYT